MSWPEAAAPAAAYAGELLASHGIDADVPDHGEPRSIAADWAACGAMWLTGTPDGAPRPANGAPATTMRGALLALAAIAGAAGLDSSRLPGPQVLSERAFYLGLCRRGRVSAGGATRLLDTADGRIALTLSRPVDFEALPALTGDGTLAADAWPALAAWARKTQGAQIVERAALLGLAASVVGPLPVDDARTASTGNGAAVRPAPLRGSLLVVDLSALWAGPLCGHLLGLLGARVVTVESARRPDPTRTVAPRFHQVLRGDAEHVVLDLDTAGGLETLTALLRRADVVIESSRPRALAQLGIDAAQIVAEAKACSWVSITAYGRAHNRIGYGDDVAAAAGLLGIGAVQDDVVFAGDAIADPLTGGHAAVAALAGVVTGRSALIDIAMYDVARAARCPVPPVEVVARGADWFVDDGNDVVAVRKPAPRPAT